MKEDTHPDNFRKVIFHDTTSGEEFLFESTVETDETGEYDGEEYPLTRVEMSSASHPFYTGVEKVVDTAGRVEKFEQRFEKSQQKQKEQNQSQEEEGGSSDGDNNENENEDDSTESQNQDEDRDKVNSEDETDNTDN